MADESYITRREHDEFAKRIDAENERQNKRIEILEKTVKDMAELPMLVKQISKNQDKQLVELEAIKNKPMQTLNATKQSIINTIVNLIATAIVSGVAASIVASLIK